MNWQKKEKQLEEGEWQIFSILEAPLLSSFWLRLQKRWVRWKPRDEMEVWEMQSLRDIRGLVPPTTDDPCRCFDNVISFLLLVRFGFLRTRMARKTPRLLRGRTRLGRQTARTIRFWRVHNTTVFGKAWFLRFLGCWEDATWLFLLLVLRRHLSRV